MRGVGPGKIVRKAVRCYKKLADFPHRYYGKTGSPGAPRYDFDGEYQGEYQHFSNNVFIIIILCMWYIERNNRNKY